MGAADAGDTDDTRGELGGLAATGAGGVDCCCLSPQSQQALVVACLCCRAIGRLWDNMLLSEPVGTAGSLSCLAFLLVLSTLQTTRYKVQTTSGMSVLCVGKVVRQRAPHSPAS